MTKNYILIAVLFFSLKITAQNSYEYTVESIPFQEFSEIDEVVFNYDDIYSSVIAIPFDFKFYSDYANYSQLVVGSNGTISFDTSNADNFAPWTFNEAIPSAALPYPSIFGPFHDMDNNTAEVEGTIFTGVSGQSPNRRFYTIFDNIPQFACNEMLSTSQIVLHETSGIIDVYIKNKPLCATWNNGNAVIGLQKEVGGEIHGIAPPGRNTGQWEATEEGWRFIPTTSFNVVVCDADNDNTEYFDFAVYANTILEQFNLDPAENIVSILDANNTEVTGTVSINAGINSYSIVMNPATDNVSFDLNISFVDCEGDQEADGLPNGMEDVNDNGNLADDDTDGDGIPNYLDNDDDGDTVVTNIELVFGGRDTTPTFLDTDNDGIYNHLDFDDDGDGVLTLDEDYNANGDPTDDDINENGVADYLDAQQLSVNDISLNTQSFTLYPNPANTILNLAFASQYNFEGHEIQVKVYDVQGRQLFEIEKELLDNKTQLDVSSLTAGHYILVVKKDGLLKAKKFIVN